MPVDHADLLDGHAECIKDEVLAPGFRISGLGQLVDSGIKADRFVTFGD